MADKDAVDPADESTPAEPTPLSDDPTDSPSEPTASGSHAVRIGGAGTDPVDPEGPYAAEELSDDEFDELVRRSGIGDDEADPTDEHDVSDVSGDDPTTSGDAAPSKVLQPAGVVAAGAGGAAKKARPVRSPKDAPTGKRDKVDKPERTTPVRFVKQSIGELRKVVYPTGQQLINYFVVVLVFVLFIIAYVSLLDLGLGAAIFKIFS